MPISMNELARAREVVSWLLEELHLQAYMFEIEPRGERWEILVECSMAGGWTRFRLSSAQDTLLQARDNALAHQQLLDDWGSVLSACVRKP